MDELGDKYLARHFPYTDLSYSSAICDEGNKR